MSALKREMMIWMPHAGHLIVSRDCQFHLNTFVNGYIISTVGEYWPCRAVREIHARVHDLAWLEENKHLRGDDFDYAYMKKFGFEMIGCNRLYETMVFTAMKSKQTCCPYKMADTSEIDSAGYNDAGKAYKGHLAMVKKYACRTMKPLTRTARG